MDVTVRVETPDPNLEIDPSDPFNVRFSALPDWYGEAEVVLRAIKGRTGLSATATIKVTVTPSPDLPIVKSLRVDPIPLDDFATRAIRFNVSDTESGILGIRAFYRLSREPEPAVKKCLLEGADETERIQINITAQAEQEVVLRWFSGIDQLADNTIQLVVELEVVDESGAFAVSERAGARPQTEMFTLDNTGRVTPLLKKINPFNGGGINGKTGEMGFQHSFFFR
jgi:hypothetical protein